MIPSVETMIEQYVNTWNATHLDAYKTGFTSCWAPDAIYTDPNHAHIQGVDALADLAQTSWNKVPGRIFNILKRPVFHHNSGRYYWTVALPEGPRQGLDYFEFNDQFQITRLVSFF
ncbi:nuclear transport factor 2 family protein [[Flexibacter] sp. ATCC 35208]|uniref:nuclear transport factor 2 family protein n=1 Tax=[Flexibacter] sp. ATCC 35208 TaxID=1936242 RepID=UPI0009CE3014|nr:nuclear transport factor 2 family protein [[Flexibacter] sp. ATCC 35208]OMP76360.1 isomerase [[Flexibacter] sp. ATCC 35208]